jgi:hypothetical protein
MIHHVERVLILWEQTNRVNPFVEDPILNGRLLFFIGKLKLEEAPERILESHLNDISAGFHIYVSHLCRRSCHRKIGQFTLKSLPEFGF